MRFIGYYVKDAAGKIKKFGAGERAAAEKYAAEHKAKVQTWAYKI